MRGKITNNVKYCHVNIDPDRSFYFDHVHIIWNQQITLHQHDELEISYIITGSGTRVIGDSVDIFSKGEVIFLPPNMPHGWYFSENDHDEKGKIENITIIFRESLLNGLAQVFPELQEKVAAVKKNKQSLSFSGETLMAVQKCMVTMVSQNSIDRLSSFLKLISIIGDTPETYVVGTRYQKDSVATKMQEINRYMVNNYQRDISLDEIAKHVAMNRSSFCTFFKKEHGRSFFTALTEFRINCSCLMLRQTPMAVADIAMAAGFNDVPHYNRTFKKIKGISPKGYRLQCQDHLI
ncbi:AraC family transcriptional regulator [Chitinophaga sancti]|uniref:AraC family transcriptional regulator n=1 Tax=Chitinophaga sancti TaxID=1004 RepID=UPI003F7AF3E9